MLHSELRESTTSEVPDEFTELDLRYKGAAFNGLRRIRDHMMDATGVVEPVGRGRLLEVLEAAGHALVELGDETCGYALLLPHGGRVLGLFSRQDGENYFWVNPGLTSVKSARQALNGETWVNTGGDRTWLAPEREIFVRDLRNAWVRTISLPV